MRPPRWLVELTLFALALIGIAVALQAAIRHISSHLPPLLVGLAVAVVGLLLSLICAWLARDLRSQAMERSPAPALLLLGVALVSGAYGYAVAYFKQADFRGPPPELSVKGAPPALVSATYHVTDCGHPVEVTVAVWVPASVLRDPARRIDVTLADSRQARRSDAESGQGPSMWLLPTPDRGLRDQRAVGQWRARAVAAGNSEDAVAAEVAEVKHRTVFHLSADLLGSRDETSCVLQIPHTREKDHVWSAVVGMGTVGLVETESKPPPAIVDRNGVALWECDRPPSPMRPPAQCEAQVTFSELDHEFERNLNAIVLGAILSLGLALIVEAIVLLSRPTRPPESGSS